MKSEQKLLDKIKELEVSISQARQAAIGYGFDGDDIVSLVTQMGERMRGAQRRLAQIEAAQALASTARGTQPDVEALTAKMRELEKRLAEEAMKLENLHQYVSSNLPPLGQ